MVNGRHREKKAITPLIWVALALISGYSKAQTIRFQTIDQEEGLSENVVNAILQDGHGFLWIGTQDGLNRYDGYQFVIYKHDPSDPHSLSDNHVSALHLDTNHTLWVGTDGAGLNRFNPDSLTFDVFQQDPTDSQSLSHNEIRAITSDPEGQLWVATSTGGVSRKSENGFRNYRADPRKEGSLRNDRADSLLVDRKGTLWVGTYSGLDRYSASEDRFIHIANAPQQPVGAQHIKSLFEDAKSNLWVGSEAGLFLYDPNLEALKPAPKSYGFPTASILSIYEDWTGALWAGTSAGLYLSHEGKSARALVHQAWNPLSISDNQTNTFLEDRTGILWIGTQNGLNSYNRQTSVFDLYRHVPGEVNSLPSKMVWAIYQDSQNELWVGTEAGLSRFKDHHKVRDYHHEADNPTSLSHDGVRDILEDSRGMFWIATRGGGLEALDRTTGTFRHFRHNPDDPGSLSHDFAWVIFENRLQQLWVGTAGGGLDLFDPETEQFRHFQHHESDPRSISSNHISALYEGSRGNLWIGTFGGGLNRFEPQTGTFQTYGHLSGISHNRILCIQEDSIQNLWLGTWGGLNRMDTRTMKAYAYREKDGLPSEVVYGILIDRNDMLWMSTNKGLCRFDPRSETFRVYTVEEGVQANEFNSGAYFKSAENTMYFGGVNGLTAFQPNQITNDSLGPQMVITHLLLDNKPVALRRQDPNSPLTVPINETKTLVLDHTQDLVTFEFAAIHFAAPTKNNYAFMLDGLTNDWIYTRADRAYATFTRIPHGHYTFRVKGTNLDGVWSEEEAQLQLVALPPPWLSPWAKVAYFVLAAMIIGVIYLIYRRRIKFERTVRETIRNSEERLKFALWGSGDEHWDWDLQNKIIYRSNQTGQLAFSTDNRQVDIDDLSSCVHPRDFDRLKLAWEDHLNGRTPYFEATYRVRGYRHDWIWILDRGKVVGRDAKGLPTRASGTVKDISLLKETEDKLRLIAIAFENTSDGVFITDSELNIVAVNQAYTRITGREPHEVLGRAYRFSQETNSKESFAEKVMSALRDSGHWQGEVQELRKNKEVYTQELLIDMVKDIEGDTCHFIGVFSDITFRKKAEQELRHLANYDILTNLPNRTLFGAHLQQSIIDAERGHRKFALLFIDLDNFKNINDSLGHSIGDLLLVEMGNRLVACARENDVVARFGGDEFCVLLKEIRLVHGAAKVAQKIIATLAEPFNLDGHNIVISPSIGIVLYPSDGKAPDALLRNADTAMYHAKSKGKNNYQFFTEEMNQRVLQRLQMEADLRAAIEAHELFLYYQPKLSFETGEIVGMEALARWRSPKHGFVSPAQFIPLAEETGLVVAMGKQILEMACRETKRWVDMSLFDGRVAVNLSALQFRQKDLLKFVDNTLAETGLSPEHLELEITEGTVMENADYAIEVMHEFRKRNLSLAIDDFGTGFSSLSYLKQFPINALKVDRSFVVDMATSEDDHTIVASIVGLAHNLGMKVVAEGVENYEQVEALRALGCEEMQGFLFSRPVPSGEFEELLRRRPNLYSGTANQTPWRKRFITPAREKKPVSET